MGFRKAGHFWAPSPIHNFKSGKKCRPHFGGSQGAFQISRACGWSRPRHLPQGLSLLSKKCPEDKTLINDWADVREICELCPNLEWLSLSRTATGLALLGDARFRAFRDHGGWSEWSEIGENGPKIVRMIRMDQNGLDKLFGNRRKSCVSSHSFLR